MTRYALVATLLLWGVATIAPRSVQAAPPPASGSASVQPHDYEKEIKAVGVTDAQKAKIAAIGSKYNDKANTIKLQIARLPADASKEYEAMLTPEQLKKAKAILLKYKQKQDALVKQVQDLEVQGNKEVDAVFTPEQSKKIREIQQQKIRDAQLLQQQQQNKPAPK